MVLLAAGVLLLGAGLVAYISAPPTASASLNYSEEDVAHEQPVLAIHEMGEGPPIPFLPCNQAQPQIQVQGNISQLWRYRAAGRSGAGVYHLAIPEMPY